jgi:hypothetical protein
LTAPVGSDNLPVMRARAILFAVLLVAVGAGCRRTPTCLANCEQRAKELRCQHAHECKEECEDLRKRTVCRAELDAFEACFLRLPKDQWYCDDGKPVPKGCPKERSAVESCLQDALTGPNPPKTL